VLLKQLKKHRKKICQQKSKREKESPKKERKEAGANLKKQQKYSKGRPTNLVAAAIAVVKQTRDGNFLFSVVALCSSFLCVKVGNTNPDERVN